MVREGREREREREGEGEGRASGKRGRQTDTMWLLLAALSPSDDTGWVFGIVSIREKDVTA